MIASTIGCCAGIGGGVSVPSDFELLMSLAAVIGGWGTVALLCFWYFFGRRQ
jgi:hypothetical protein